MLIASVIPAISKDFKIISLLLWRQIQKNPQQGENLSAEKEVGKTALMHDPFSVAWKRKNKEKLIPETVGHVLREISRAVWFFLEVGGKVSGRVCEKKYRPSPIPKGGLEILLKVTFSIPDNKRRFLDRLKDIIEVNYGDSFGEGYELGVEICGSLLEDYHSDSDSSGNCLIDDEDVICID